MDHQQIWQLRNQLVHAKAERDARQLDVVLKSAEISRLERRLRHLQADSDDDSEEEEDRRIFIKGKPKYPVPASMILSEKDKEPPNGYDCIGAGQPPAQAMIGNMMALPCHWRRSSEVTKLLGCNLASQSEIDYLRDVVRLSGDVMEQHTVVNLLVWRRSVLLMVFLSSLGAFVFSLFGDNWVAFDHMQEMEDLSSFKASYADWREQARAELPWAQCTEIDAQFAEVLTRLGHVHQVAGRSCAELIQQGIGCKDTVDRAVVGCWTPGLCFETIDQHCPSMCGHTGMCRDIRNSRSMDYTTFTMAFARAIMYKLVEQLSKAELFKMLFSMVAKFVACILMLNAALNWEDWPKSNSLMRWAWVVTFTAPFLRSIVPTPLLIDWVPIASHMEEYLVETDTHFDLASRMNYLSHITGLSCQGHQIEDETSKFWKTTHHKVHWWCGKVQWAAHWAPWSPMLQKGATQCQVLNNYMGVGDVATLQAKQRKEQLCQAINATHIQEGPLSGIREVIDVKWLRSAAYALVGGLSSLLSFRAVMPEALSVAPGLLTAAMRLKVVVPQSYLPGVFVAIMPLLYVPTVWAFCIFAVQGVGDPLLLVAFTLMVFSPLAYSIVGVVGILKKDAPSWSCDPKHREKVTAPMSTTGVRSYAAIAQRCINLMRFFSIICFGLYTTRVAMHLHQIEESKKGVAAFLLREGEQMLLPLLVGQAQSVVSLLFSGPLWSLIFTFWTEMYMTAIVGADWMMHAAAEEYCSHGQNDLLDGPQGPDSTVEAAQFLKQKTLAMEAMLDITKHRPPRGEGH